jgi:hypothetical protein
MSEILSETHEIYIWEFCVLFLFSDSVRYVFVVRVLVSESQATDSVILLS